MARTADPTFVTDARPRVEAALLAAVTTDDAFLTEVASHLIKAGGKRVRPMFAAGAGACAGLGSGSVSDHVILGGVAVELVHLGSLYHDDVIDEAETRRGVESVNARWGNLKAILAGDFLLAKASEIAAGLGTEVAVLLAATIGRLCEGEVGELRSAYDVSRTEAAYLSSIRGKTASLFATACRIGGIVADLPSATTSTRSPRSATATAWRSRSSTTSSTWWPPTSSWASRPGTTSSRACTRCPCCGRWRRLEPTR